MDKRNYYIQRLILSNLILKGGKRVGLDLFISIYQQIHGTSK
jgi:hypothetical protein